MLWTLACQAARRTQKVTRSGYAPSRPGQSSVDPRGCVPGPPRPYSSHTRVASSFGAAHVCRCRRTICTRVYGCREHTDAGHSSQRYRARRPRGCPTSGHQCSAVEFIHSVTMLVSLPPSVDNHRPTTPSMASASRRYTGSYAATAYMLTPVKILCRRRAFAL